MNQKMGFIIPVVFLILSLSVAAQSAVVECPSSEYLEKVYQYTLSGVVLDNADGTVTLNILELNFTPESPYQQLGVYTEELTQIREEGTVSIISQPIREGTTIFAYLNKAIGETSFHLAKENCALTITKEPVNVPGGLMIIIIFLLIGAGVYYVKGKE